MLYLYVSFVIFLAPKKIRGLVQALYQVKCLLTLSSWIENIT